MFRLGNPDQLDWARVGTIDNGFQKCGCRFKTTVLLEYLNVGKGKENVGKGVLKINVNVKILNMFTTFNWILLSETNKKKYSFFLSLSRIFLTIFLEVPPHLDRTTALSVTNVVYDGNSFLQNL